MTGTVLEIFKPGTFTAMGGEQLTFSEGDVAAIAAGYDPAAQEAPLVVGHPKMDAPAYGWVKALRFASGRLLAEPHKVDPAFAELVRAGRYRRISPSFYRPDHPSNPKPGTYYLRHVGFLGAAAPAVKGLKPAEFADDGAGLVTIEFGDDPDAGGPSEADRLRAELDALKAQLAERDAAFAEQQRAVCRTGNSAFLDGLIKDGRFLPVFRDGMLDFMDTLDSTAAVDFAEHGEATKMTPADYFRRYLQHQPKVIEFAELAAGGGDEDAGGGPAAQAERIAAFVESERQQGRAVSYSDAARRIGAGNRRG